MTEELIKIPSLADDVCLVCDSEIPQGYATYVKVVNNYVRRAHLACGDRINKEDTSAWFAYNS